MWAILLLMMRNSEYVDSGVGSEASVSTEASLRDHSHRVAALTIRLHKK
jgi:hypothetical protein